jgi:hypothetical protein
MTNRASIGLLQGWPLFAILCLLLLRQLVWSFTSPLYQAPDEVAHLQMAALLDRYGLSYYGTQAPVAWRNFEASPDFRDDYYSQKGLIWALDRRQAFSADSRFAPGERERLHAPLSKEPFPETTWMATYGYPPLYYLTIGKAAGAVRMAGASLIDYQFSMRVAQALLCTLFYFLAAVIIRRTIASEPIQLLTFIAIAFHPLTSFVGSIINNDNGLLPSLALVVLGAIDVLKRRKVVTAVVVMAAGGVLMALTKPTGQLYLLACVATLVVLLVRQSRFRDASLAVAPVVLAFVAEKGVRGLTGEYTLIGDPDVQSIARLYQIMVDIVGWNMIKNIFGQFAWFEVNYANWVYWLFLSLLLASIIPMSMVCVRWIFRGAQAPEAFAVFFFGAGLAIIVGAFVTQYMLLPKVGPVIQGRYILPAIHFAFLALGATSCVSAALPRYLSITLLFALAAICVAGSAGALPMIIDRFYSDPSGQGISLSELLNRLAQYKPLIAKPDAFWFGAATVVGASHLLAGLAIVWAMAAVTVGVGRSPAPHPRGALPPAKPDF